MLVSQILLFMSIGFNLQPTTYNLQLTTRIFMANIKKVKLSIEGMHCGSCAMGIQMLLQNTDGVLESSADYDSKSGEVEYDEEKISFDDMKKAIADLGYRVTPKSE